MVDRRSNAAGRVTLIVLVSLASARAIAEPSATADSQQSQPPGVVSSEFIFTKAPFAECHASTIAKTPAGLVTAWFGGTEEKNPDVGIWVSRQVDGKWTAPIEVANGVQSPSLRYPTWNPVLFQPKEGPLLLFYKVGPSPDTWWGMMTTSKNHGATWSTPRRLPDGMIGPVKNKPIQLEDDTLVCPSSTENNGWQLHLERTPNLGQTWTSSGPLNDGREKSAIQPSILLHHDGRWQLLARDRRGQGYIWTTWSTDGGKTWTDLEATSLPNPSSGIDAVTLKDGRQLLVYNHTQRKRDRFEDSRSLLNVAVSDDGKTWQAAFVLEDSPGEYSYPAIIQTDDGLVHITYTWKRERVKHVVVDPTKLQLTPLSGGAWPGVDSVIR